MKPLELRLPAALKPCLAGLARVVCTDEVQRLGLEEDVVAHVADSLLSLPPHLRAGLIAGLAGFEMGAVARYGRPFSRLDGPRQDAYFGSWWHSPIFAVRQLIKGIKGLVALGYWDHPTVLQRLGYDPATFIAEVGARRERDYAADIAAHEVILRAPDPLREVRR